LALGGQMAARRQSLTLQSAIQQKLYGHSSCPSVKTQRRHEQCHRLPVDRKSSTSDWGSARLNDDSVCRPAGGFRLASISTFWHKCKTVCPGNYQPPFRPANTAKKRSCRTMRPSSLPTTHQDVISRSPFSRSMFSEPVIAGVAIRERRLY